MMSSEQVREDTALNVIEKIFQDLRNSFNQGKTKPIAWRRKQIEQVYKMCDEQRDYFARAAYADFQRPNFETKLFDCGSVRYSVHPNIYISLSPRFEMNVFMH